MKRIWLLALLLLAAGPRPSAFAVTNAVEVLRADWHDAQRDRTVPVKLYYPQIGAGPFPVIVFSHGLGGSREGYEYLGRYWAAHGYVSVHLQHAGSDDSVWQDHPVGEIKTRLRRAAADPANAANRPLDVSFAIDQLEHLNQEHTLLKGKLDLSRIGVAGHSFGAFTALAVAGHVLVAPAGREISYQDTRVKAVIAMSAPVPVRRDNLDRAFGKISIPVYHLTGTQDSSPIGETRPEERRVAFDHIRGSPQYLLTLQGGDHSVFSGASRTVPPAREQRFKELICESTTAFWDAYLKGGAASKSWLKNEFPSVLASDGAWEIKAP